LSAFVNYSQTEIVLIYGICKLFIIIYNISIICGCQCIGLSGFHLLFMECHYKISLHIYLVFIENDI